MPAVPGDDLGGGADAVEDGHPQVDQRHVGLQPFDELDGLPAVGGLADDVDGGLGGQQRDDAGAHHVWSSATMIADLSSVMSLLTVGGIVARIAGAVADGAGDGQLAAEFGQALAHAVEAEAVRVRDARSRVRRR